MYKKLSREEERLIREHTDKAQPAPPKWVVIRNALIFALIFLLFTVAAYLVVISGTTQ